MTPSPRASELRALLSRALGIEPREVGAVAAGMGVFFLLFTAYFLLRPVRETMGIAGGVDQLQWLFTGTFIATLAAVPLFGWLAARARRRRILPWTYVFFAANLVGFGIGFTLAPENVWLARAFYIWLSVFSLLSVSVAWSVLADLFALSQAKRLFALMAAGASAGGLLGPILSVSLVAMIGHEGLLWLSATLLLAAIAVAQLLQRWRDRHPLTDGDEHARSRPLGGSPFQGLEAVLRSPLLLGIAVFVLLLASATTFLYFEQARVVAETFPDRVEQTRVFGLIDAIVQGLAIITQVLLTGRIAQRLGVGVLLVAVPLTMAVGFLWLAFAPAFAVLAVVMVARRAGEYALVRPGREMLFTVVPVQDKYKAKNFIDTVVYRGADAVSGWVKIGVDALAQQPAVAMTLGAVLALIWAGTGLSLTRAHQRAAATTTD